MTRTSLAAFIVSLIAGSIMPIAYAHDGTAPTCNGKTATIWVNHHGVIVGGPQAGTNFSGTLTGTSGDDVIVTENNASVVNALAGNDTVCGGNAADVLNGGAGNDWLSGGNGPDALNGEGDNDTLDGGNGPDNCDGGAGSNSFANCENITGGAGSSASSSVASSTPASSVASLSSSVASSVLISSVASSVVSSSVASTVASSSLAASSASSVQCPAFDLPDLPSGCSYEFSDLNNDGCTEPTGFSCGGSSASAQASSSSSPVSSSSSQAASPIASSSVSSAVTGGSQCPDFQLPTLPDGCSYVYEDINNDGCLEPTGFVCSGSSSSATTSASSSVSSGPVVGQGCQVAGCSSELCVDEGTSVNSACEWKPQYVCYQNAICEKQSDNHCGWTQTQELTSCLAANASSSGPVMAGSSSSAGGGTGGGGSALQGFSVIEDAPGGNGARRGDQTNVAYNVVNFLAKKKTIGGLPGAAFGGTSRVPLSETEVDFICAMQRAMPKSVDDIFIEHVAMRMSSMMNRDTGFLVKQLKNEELCEEISLSRMPKLQRVASVRLVGFPVDESMVPLSTNETWNACIRRNVSLELIRENTDRDEDNLGKDCSTYRQEDQWTHPDLGITFGYDRLTGTITLPGGYVIQQTGGSL